MNSANTFTAVIMQDGVRWVGWMEEIPGVNSQGETREDLMDSLRSAAKEVIAMNREEALADAGDDYAEESIKL